MAALLKTENMTMLHTAALELRILLVPTLAAVSTK